MREAKAHEVGLEEGVYGGDVQLLLHEPTGAEIRVRASGRDPREK